MAVAVCLFGAFTELIFRVCSWSCVATDISSWLFKWSAMTGQRFLKRLAHISLPVFAEGLCVYGGACHQHPSRQFITLSPHSVSVCANLQGPLEVRAHSCRIFFSNTHRALHVCTASECPGCTGAFQSPWTSLSSAFSSRIFDSSLVCPICYPAPGNREAKTLAFKCS